MIEDAIEIIRLSEPPQNGYRPANGAHYLQAGEGGDPYEKVKLLIHSLLAVLGEDPGRPGLQRTPQRVARMYGELLSGYEMNAHALVNGALFAAHDAEMVAVTNITFHSLCEHHLLPFYGTAHVAYIPDQTIIGLSKIPRIVEMYARRLQIQERMTAQVADELEAVLQPQGVAVVVEATHLCMTMRGVRQPQAQMRTSVMRGLFRDDPALRREFVQQMSAGL